jgi:sensor histidine kinase YesM
VDESIDAEHLQIPPMMIQPFVENAIIHGIRRKSTPGFISIHFKTEGEMLNCTVRDNGIGRKKAAEINAQAKSLHKSTAISITQKRLQQYSQHREVAAGIEIIDLEENNNSTGTQVTVLTPFETF